MLPHFASPPNTGRAPPHVIGAAEGCAFLRYSTRLAMPIATGCAREEGQGVETMELSHSAGADEVYRSWKPA